MDLEKLQQKLIGAARKNPPSDAVPFAFEKRIMAHLTRPMIDVWSAWGRALWRAAAACVLAMALFGGWFYQSAVAEKPDLSQDLKNTVFAALDEHSQLSGIEENW